MESLRTVGITDFRLCLGHVDFAGGLLASCGLTTKETEKIQAAIENKNLVKLKNLTEKLNLSPARQSALAQIPLLYGDESVLERAEQLVANPQSSAALANLRQIYALVQKYGSAEHIAFDLGLIRDFAYYTGPVWEIYVPTLGFPLCGGGRYDRLLAKFGRDLPATGFALGIERIMLATGQIC